MKDYSLKEPVFRTGWLEMAVGIVIIVLVAFSVSFLIFMAYLPRMVEEVPKQSTQSHSQAAFEVAAGIMREWRPDTSTGLRTLQNGRMGTVELDVKTMEKSGGVQYDN